MKGSKSCSSIPRTDVRAWALPSAHLIFSLDFFLLFNDPPYIISWYPLHSHCVFSSFSLGSLEWYPYNLCLLERSLVHHQALFHHYVLFGIIILCQWCTSYGSAIAQSFIEYGKTPGKGKFKAHEFVHYVVAHYNMSAYVYTWTYLTPSKINRYLISRWVVEEDTQLWAYVYRLDVEYVMSKNIYITIICW